MDYSCEDLRIWYPIVVLGLYWDKRSNGRMESLALHFRIMATKAFPPLLESALKGGAPDIAIKLIFKSKTVKLGGLAKLQNRTFSTRQIIDRQTF